MIKIRKINSNSIIACVAVATLLLAIWQNYETRKISIEVTNFFAARNTPIFKVVNFNWGTPHLKTFVNDDKGITASVPVLNCEKPANSVSVEYVNFSNVPVVLTHLESSLSKGKKIILKKGDFPIVFGDDGELILAPGKKYTHKVDSPDIADIFKNMTGPDSGSLPILRITAHVKTWATEETFMYCAKLTFVGACNDTYSRNRYEINDNYYKLPLEEKKLNRDTCAIENDT